MLLDFLPIWLHHTPSTLAHTPFEQQPLLFSIVFSIPFLFFSLSVVCL